MKKFLLVFLLACGATALANTTDPIQEKRAHAVTHTSTAKEISKVAKPTLAGKPVVLRDEAAAHVIADGSRSGLGAYIVDFINRNNIKIIRKLLVD